MENFIKRVVYKHYDTSVADKILDNAYILQYLDNKTKSVDRSSKSRGSFANIYAIYVLVEDYIKNGYLDENLDYSKYDGMMFTNALNRMRELPFGEKIQNHALNNRCNDEFKKFFIEHTSEVPIIRDLITKRYWINEKLLKIFVDGTQINIAKICTEIIEKYIELKQENFIAFFDDLNALKEVVLSNPQAAVDFLANLLKPSSDARIFEIVSYVIIKYSFIEHSIQYSINGQEYKSTKLTVYKIGRTNANDGGIDYIMLPLGRIFQVTEVLDFKKYFLDIDKLIHYPITFVIKQDITPENAMAKIKKEASLKYKDKVILSKYLDCFEELITLPTLKAMLADNIKKGYLDKMIDELINQCKVEYNIDG